MKGRAWSCRMASTTDQENSTMTKKRPTSSEADEEIVLFEGFLSTHKIILTRKGLVKKERVSLRINEAEATTFIA